MLQANNVIERRWSFKSLARINFLKNVCLEMFLIFRRAFIRIPHSGVFKTQSNIYNKVFFAKIVNAVYPLIVLAKNSILNFCNSISLLIFFLSLFLWDFLMKYIFLNLQCWQYGALKW